MPHIQESHPEPNERTIMPVFDSKKAETPIFETLTGDYPFEIVAVDNSISKGGKTSGAEVREVKLKFYKDANFTQPVAQWTEDFINSDNCLWKWFVFSKCVGFVFTDGHEFDIDATWIGRRGWATCKPERDKNDAQKFYNRVAVFITNKTKLPPNVQAAQKADDDLPPF